MVATYVVDSLIAWIAIGLTFGLWFVAVGVRRVDADTATAGFGFRALILPAAAALWPLLLWRCLRGPSDGAIERNAHRDAARPR